MKKILISTGGSGGHVVPALNFYNHLKKEFEVILYTDKRGAKYFPKEVEKTIFDVKKFPEKKIFFPFKIITLFFALIKSIIYMRKFNYDIIISTGGYMSLPIVVASRLYNKKIFLFEPNSIIGKSNKFLLKFSEKLLCYDINLKGVNKKYKDKILKLPPILNKCFYNKTNEIKIVDNTIKMLVIGGSQSSAFFSKYLKNDILKLALKYRIKITQQISQGFDLNNYKIDYEKLNIENNLFFFEENFLCKNHNFDIAISRAGASTLAELAHLNIPFVAIPFPHATDDHQFLNAKRYHKLNCCWILEEKNFNSGDIFKIINEIVINKNDYLEKKNNLKKINENKNWENINKLIKNIFL